MRRLNKPIFDPVEIYDACISGINDSALAKQFFNARAAMVIHFQEYEHRASTHQLFSFVASATGNEMQYVFAGITKKEFTDLYSTQMVGKGKSGRKYYDRLMMLAPLSKCPFCGFGQVSTLDHFLSKAHYPVFSVLCTNLIPACSDCNKRKTASMVTQTNQMLHPYFEDFILEADLWLFAEVIESVPATIRYFIQPPNSWSSDLIIRADNYFKDLDLALRFAIEAAAELAGLTQLLDDLETIDSRYAHLSRVARVERQNQKNSWKAALYEALANSSWFQCYGYQNRRY